MGNSLEQYRAAIGNFYFSCRCVCRSVLVNFFGFSFFSKIFMFPSIGLFALAMKHLSRHIVVYNFYLQFFMFLLLLCGDIEVNPGPIMTNVLDILHLNIRSIRNKVANLNTIVHDFDILCFTETHLDRNVTN